MKKKIIEYIWTLNDGGAETLVKDYALLLNQEHYEVVVVVNVINRETANLRRLTENNIRVIPIYKKWNAVSKLIALLANDIVIPRRLKRIIKHEKPDVIHAHLAVLKYLDSISNELMGIKLFYTCHSEPEKVFKNCDKKKEYAAASNLVKNNQLRFIALHNEMCKQLNSMFSVDNTVVLRNGIDISNFNVNESKEQCRHQIGIPKQAFVLGHVGRLAKVKNHDLILNVFSQISKKNADAMLLLVGDGELRNEIECKIRDFGIDDRVIILSNRTDIPKLLKCMDCFIFPSFYEGLGIAFIEAQIMGINCVISDRIPREACITKNYMVLSVEDDITCWVDAVENFVGNSQIYVDGDEYNMNNEISKLEDIYAGNI